MKCHACGNQAALGSDIHSAADDNGSGPTDRQAEAAAGGEGEGEGERARGMPPR